MSDGAADHRVSVGILVIDMKLQLSIYHFLSVLSFMWCQGHWVV